MVRSLSPRAKIDRAAALVVAQALERIALRRVVPRERPRLRPCLAPGHDHLIPSTRAVRMCERGREEVARLESRFGGSLRLSSAAWRPRSGLDTHVSG
jgi:hypothetical protein